jgi:hypothetical protein
MSGRACAHAEIESVAERIDNQAAHEDSIRFLKFAFIYSFLFQSMTMALCSRAVMFFISLARDDEEAVQFELDRPMRPRIELQFARGSAYIYDLPLDRLDVDFQLVSCKNDDLVISIFPWTFLKLSFDLLGIDFHKSQQVSGERMSRYPDDPIVFHLPSSFL